MHVAALLVQYADMSLDFSVPFARLSMEEAVMRYAPCSQEDLSEKNIDKLLQKYHIKMENKNAQRGYKLAELFGKVAEPHLIQPTFITHYPVEISPLSKRDSENPNIAARYELFVAGMELSNGFNELNDPFDQADRFREQVLLVNLATLKHIILMLIMCLRLNMRFHLRLAWVSELTG